MGLQENGQLEWKGSGPTLANAKETVRDRRPRDSWASGIPKASLVLLRIRWKWLPTMDQLHIREATIEVRCLLCGSCDEYIQHLFY